MKTPTLTGVRPFDGLDSASLGRAAAFALYACLGLDTDDPVGALGVADALLGPHHVRLVDPGVAPLRGLTSRLDGERWIWLRPGLSAIEVAFVIYHELGHCWAERCGWHWRDFGDDFRGEERFADALADAAMIEIDGHDPSDVRAARGTRVQTSPAGGA